MFWAGWFVGALLLVSPVQATLLKYELSGADNLSFVLDASRATDGISAGGDGFYFSSIQNTSSNNPFPYLTFYDANYGDPLIGSGGLSAGTEVDDGGGVVYFDLVSPLFMQLFAGTVSNPVLLTGTFSLVDINNPSREDTLRVTEITAAVPETGTWAMMILGFAAVGCMRALRRRAPASAALWSH